MSAIEHGPDDKVACQPKGPLEIEMEQVVFLSTRTTMKPLDEHAYCGAFARRIVGEPSFALPT